MISWFFFIFYFLDRRSLLKNNAIFWRGKWVNRLSTPETRCTDQAQPLPPSSPKRSFNSSPIHSIGRPSSDPNNPGDHLTRIPSQITICSRFSTFRHRFCKDKVVFWGVCHWSSPWSPQNRGDMQAVQNLGQFSLTGVQRFNFQCPSFLHCVLPSAPGPIIACLLIYSFMHNCVSAVSNRPFSSTPPNTWMCLQNSSNWFSTAPLIGVLLD